MRKILPVLALFSVVLLPGCILALGDGDGNRDDGRLRTLEKRVTALEKHCQHDCGEGCRYCAAEK